LAILLYMPSDDEAAEADHILEALRRIQRTLDHQERPLARACGLTEKMFLLLDDSQLIEVSHFASEGGILDRHRIERISPKRHAILAANPVEKEPLKVIVEVPQKSVRLQIAEVTGKTLWGLIKLVFPLGVALFVAWYAWKKHWH
jgi:hypothetical protein